MKNLKWNSYTCVCAHQQTHAHIHRRSLMGCVCMCVCVCVWFWYRRHKLMKVVGKVCRNNMFIMNTLVKQNKNKQNV